MFSSSCSSIIPFLSFPPSHHLKSSTPRKSPNFPRKIVASCATTTQNRAPCSSATKMASSASLYQVLGIQMGATCNEIKAAYRRLARTCHPDVVAMNQKESSANEFMKIHSAYSTLSDPNKRAQYDREIYGHNRRPLDYSSLTSADIASMSGYHHHHHHRYAQSGMKWETDQCW